MARSNFLLVARKESDGMRVLRQAAGALARSCAWCLAAQVEELDGVASDHLVLRLIRDAYE